MAAANDGLDFTSGEIEEQRIGYDMQRTGMKKSKGKELPPCPRDNPFVAEAKAIHQPTGLGEMISLEHLKQPLRRERSAKEGYQ